jgi:hypothetical protein
MKAFKLGAVVMTQGAKRLMEELELDPAHYLARHVTGDWGDLSADDKRKTTTQLPGALGFSRLTERATANFGLLPRQTAV